MFPPEEVHFADAGNIPNSALPLLLWRGVFSQTKHLADEMESCFAKNGWTNSWRAGVFPFHHYHSTSHEVLGVSDGSATLQLGGEPGRAFGMAAGDVIVLPAGVGHQCLAHSGGFSVVGAYPGGRDSDLLRGEAGERPQADLKIAAVPLPASDPLQGSDGPLMQLWRSV